MSSDIDLRVRAGIELSQVEETKTELNGIVDYFSDAFTNAENIIWNNFTSQGQLAYKDVSASFEKLGGSLKSTTVDALGGSVVSVFRGEIDQIDDLWENAWNGMSQTAEGIIGGLFDKLAAHLIAFTGNMGMDFLVNPTVDWLGSLTGLGDIFSGESSYISDFLIALENSDSIAEALEMASIIGQGGLTDKIFGGLLPAVVSTRTSPFATAPASSF